MIFKLLSERFTNKNVLMIISYIYLNVKRKKINISTTKYINKNPLISWKYEYHLTKPPTSNLPNFCLPFCNCGNCSRPLHQYNLCAKSSYHPTPRKVEFYKCPQTTQLRQRKYNSTEADIYWFMREKNQV